MLFVLFIIIIKIIWAPNKMCYKIFSILLKINLELALLLVNEVFDRLKKKRKFVAYSISKV